VHHIFPGGWVWVLKFNNGITSAGVAATEPLANQLNLRAGEAGWKNLLQELPSLAEIFHSAKAVVPFIHQPRVSFQSSVVTGKRWAMLPSAAGVVDPLLSTGFPLTLLGIERLAGILRRHGTGLSCTNELQDYGRLTTRELETTAQLVAALYSTMDRFNLFRELSLLYFAAASFSETARRLNKPALADSFLLCKHPVFGPELLACCRRATQAPMEAEAADLQKKVQHAIEPFEVAGLTDRARHPWYPALVSDLYAATAKLSVSEMEIRMMLKECGLEQLET
jgi:FADH2 O2-dependent halogenase